MKRHGTRKWVLQLLRELVKRQNKLYIGHIRGHTGLPGPLAEGNRQADLFTQVYPAVEQALENHKLHHQNALALRRMFHLTREQAR